MRDVVAEFSDFRVLRAHILVGGWARWMHLKVIPVAIAVGACSTVSPNHIIRVRDPEGRWSLVGVQKTPGPAGVDDQVPLDEVVSLDGILYEHGVAHTVIDDVILDSQVVDAVDGHATIVGLVNCIVADVGVLYVSAHVEVNRIPSKLESLANIGQLDVLDPSHHWPLAARVEHDVATVLVSSRSPRIASENDVSR